MSEQQRDYASIAFGALVLGAIAMGISPIFVRLAEVGPFAGAFWRVALALPALWIWMRFEAGHPMSLSESLPTDKLVLLAGALFAGDLFFWHLAILNTTVANATFLAAIAPLCVVIGAWFLLGEAIVRRTIFAMLLSIVGAALLLGSSYSYAPENLTGDIFGLITACFFGAYFLAVRPVRQRLPAGKVIFQSSLVTAAILFLVTLISGETFLPESWNGVFVLIVLALISHAGGQGLLSFSLGHLPAGYSSLVIFLEGVAAAFFGWLVLAETLGPMQFAGCALITGAVFWTRPKRKQRVAN